MRARRRKLAGMHSPEHTCQAKKRNWARRLLKSWSNASTTNGVHWSTDVPKATAIASTLMPTSVLPVLTDRRTPTCSRPPLEHVPGCGTPRAEALEAVLDSLRVTAVHMLENPSQHADMLCLLRDLSMRLETRHAELVVELSTRSYEFGRYNALLSGHIVRSSTHQLARARELVQVCESRPIAEAARAVSVGVCVLSVETRSLRAELELLFDRSGLREAG